MKTCSKCKQLKERAEFGKNSGKYDGMNSYCKPCMAAYYQENRARIAARKKEYAAENAEHIAQKKREWKERNAEKVSEYTKQYYAGNREACIDKVAEWRKRNPDARKAEYQKSAVVTKQRAKAWLLANPAKRRMFWANYHASKLRSVPSWANRGAIAVLYGNMSVLNRDGRFGKFHVDHIVPLRHPLVCGLHTPENLRLISAASNMAKSNRVWPDMP